MADSMSIDQSERGFDTVNFVDLFGQPCSLTKSSSAIEASVWIGVSDGTSNSMHLSQESVRRLLPFLQRFAETGEIAATPTSAPV